MAMKIKQLINSLLLIISIMTLLHFSVADPHEDYTTEVWRFCGDSGENEFSSGSAFQRNLNNVLNSLVGKVSSSGFNTLSVDEKQNSNSTVYGLVQCRGDLGSSDCKLCAATAKANLLQDCYNTSGFIYLAGCFLRYNSFNFYNNISYNSLNKIKCGSGTATGFDQFSADTQTQLRKTAHKAAESPKLFAADVVDDVISPSYKIYSMAQCIGEMSRESCNACLAFCETGIFAENVCNEGTLGARYLSLNCHLRFETFPFLNVSFLSPAPAPFLSPAPAPRPRPLPLSSGGKRSNVLQITLGIVAPVLGSIALISFCKWKHVSRRKRLEQIYRTPGPEISLGGEIKPIENLELIFKYDILREATSNFKEENKLGQGGFGSVFKGNLPDGRVVAVKRLNMGSNQGHAEFLNEANLITCIQHRNLVKLLGCSFESSERLLVYEYLPNSSLDKILFDTTKHHLLNWHQRYEIIVGTARGLAYLHEESEIRIIHRDIKASNILLDSKLRPKIADFGLAKFFTEDLTHVTTGIAGTIGYMAPEYALRGQLTEKADVFGFGVLLLEIISGRKNRILAEEEFLIGGAWRLYKAEKALEIMDPTLEGSYSWEEGIRVIKIGLLCTQAVPTLRPSMSRVVSMLTSEKENVASPTRPTLTDLDVVNLLEQVEPGRVIDPQKTSKATTSSGAVDPSSGSLEPR
eukprot:PITA_15957